MGEMVARKNAFNGCFCFFFSLQLLFCIFFMKETEKCGKKSVGYTL